VGRLNDQRGMGAVFLLSMLPTVLSIAAVAAGIGLAMLAHATNLFSCRMHLMDTQQSLADPLNRLLQMNNQAQALHVRYIAAKEAAAAAPNPITLAALHAQIAANTAFHSQQLQLLNQAKMAPQMKLNEMPGRMNQALNQEIPFGNNLLDVQPPAPRLAVTPFQLDELTWTFQTAPGFSILETLTANWRLHLDRVLPVWLKNMFDQVPDIEGQCSATLKKGDSQWIPTLGVGKSS
jgi:hypothetical protein